MFSYPFGAVEISAKYSCAIRGSVLLFRAMKATPGTLREGGAAFGTTHWSVVGACRDDGEMAAGASHAALTRLCRDYWPPLYSFARRRGYSPADAQDWSRDFFASFLKTKGYTQAERAKGKFRTFLLASLKHYMANVWDRDHALKRGGDCGFVFSTSEVEAVEALHVCGMRNRCIG